MSTKLNTNSNAVELTQAELDSVTGGNIFNDAVDWFYRRHRIGRKG
jgi:hypothetical protein